MLVENEFIQNIINNVPRHHDQLNKVFESDAELVKIGQDCTLAVTTDTIIEEINVGLYKDPFQIGWMMATSNLSDIAAVGAKPIGLLVNLHIPKDCDEGFIQSIYRGIAEACKICGACILGGDTNHAQHLELGGTAVGLIGDERVITRKGCQSGDLLYATGKLGAGGFYAFQQLFPSHDIAFKFLPKARIAEGQIIKKLGKTCIDTSDSLFPAISNLMDLNEVGVKINMPVDALLDQQYLRYLQNTPIEPWFLLAGPHGEFELLFTVDQSKEEALMKESAKINWNPIRIGEIITEPAMVFSLEGNSIYCDPDDISNLYEISGGNLDEYMKALIKQHKQWKKSKKKEVSIQ